ncbi:MAG: SMC-Scp complex subunit ScpB [Nitrospirae bacterium]|nr:SMC-Scp complex subunit ScpB [Nitrospirota bacterium]
MESTEADRPRQICAVLIGSGRALAPAEIGQVLGIETHDVESVMEHVKDRLAGVGLALVSDEKGRWLVAVGAAGRVMVARLNGDPLGRRQLSTEAAETLALLQEKGPLTIKEMARIRGANPRNAVETLRALGLVRRAGRSRGRGGAWLYRVSATVPDGL